jgi:transmembrane sensor
MVDPYPPESAEAQAIAWVVRVNDPAFAEWEAFAGWMAQSPAHAEAYHAATVAEADAVALLASTPAPARIIPLVQPTRRRWMGWTATALAASLVAVVGIRVADQNPTLQIYETAPGVQRTVTLADGSTVKLNGGTRLVADGDNPRKLTLERGEGLFVVRHDAQHPFTVAVGGATVTDIGTQFNIVRDGGATRIAVAEGAVEWSREGNAVRLDAGRRLRAEDGKATVELASVAPDAVGGWSRGQLVFDGALLSSAAADLARALGIAITVAPDIAGRPVRGVVQLEGGADTVVPRLAALLGVRAERDGQGWRLLASS